MKTKSLQPEQLEKVKLFETVISEKIQELGIASYEEVTARNKVVAITEELNQTIEQKNEYYSELREIYGDGTINLSEGTFLPATAESAQ
jgi:hypothetical protein